MHLSLSNRNITPLSTYDDKKSKLIEENADKRINIKFNLINFIHRGI